jgi:DNA-binding MarR family transcriptional regulator
VSKHFTASERAAWGGLLDAFARMDRLVDADLLANDGISHTEYEVLLRLSFAPGGRMRIQDLAADSILTRSGTSRLVNRLERAGLVLREAVPEDRRGSYALLTEAGRVAFDRAASRHTAFVREHFLGRLAPEDIDALGAIWRKLED